VLLAHGIEVPLVVTHADSPGETIWFDSVARHAAWHGLPVLMPADANAPEVVERVRATRPDFLFSFYYRQMLGAPLLEAAARGAYNMHGSLLPRYRGRVPVNWAVLNGERETGATLHAMTVKPDAGAIVAQQAVPILPDDTAVEVFRKVTLAAEIALDGCLPALVAGTAALKPQNLSQGSYFGRRTARDGAIDWRRGALAVHNLVRAVAPPYPGAFTEAQGMPLRILRSLPLPPVSSAVHGGGGRAAAAGAGKDVIGARAAEWQPLLLWRDGVVLALCHDGALQLLEFELGDGITTAQEFHRRFGGQALALKPVLE
jgi:methionyl-tRNA formyltransferase